MLSERGSADDCACTSTSISVECAGDKMPAAKEPAGPVGSTSGSAPRSSAGGAAPSDDDSTLPGSRRTVDEPSGPITMEVVVASTLAVDVGADFDAGDSLLHAASNSTTAVKGAKHRPVTWVILAWCDHLHRRCPSRRDRCRTVSSSLGPRTHT